MIEEIRGSNIGGSRGSKPSEKETRSAHVPEEAKSSPQQVQPELRNRLSSIAGELEGLLGKLSRSDKGSENAEGLQRSISTAQVALQNVLSVDTADPELTSERPPVEGFNLDRQNILRLLGQE